MAWGGIILLLLFLMWRVGSHQAKRNTSTQATTTGGQKFAVDTATYPVSRPLPLAARVRLWWHSRKERARLADGCEYNLGYDQASEAIEVGFYCERRLLRLTVRIPFAKPIGIENCGYLVGQDWLALDYGVAYSSKQGTFFIHLSFSERTPVKRVRIQIVKGAPSFNYAVSVLIARGEHHDYALISSGFALYAQDRCQAAIEKFKAYCELAPGNPAAYMVMARAYSALKQQEQAEFYAMRAAANGYAEQGTALYQSIQAESPFIDLSTVRGLQHESQNWQPGSHHGVIVLSQEQRFRFGMDGWYVKKYRGLFEIRREVAARFLTRLDMAYTSQDVLIESRMRIIHSDDTTETLTPDRFSIGDSHARNVFIEHEVDKLGTWLLPDLAAGDVIEWTFHVAYHEKYRIGNIPHVFVLVPLSHSYFPTFQATHEFRTPATWDLKCASVNGAPLCDRIDLVDSQEVAYRYSASHLIPIKGTGSQYETNLYNPLVACASGAPSWAELAMVLTQRNIGSYEEDEPLPDPLADIASSSSDRCVCLEQTYYWVRDKIRYGSFVSAVKQIGNRGRMEAIVKSGFGDCKDKSYVLAQVARKLGLPHQFVVISSKQGVIIEELPADQFDHIFVRVSIDGSWLYLDATGSDGVFGLPNVDYQGLRALLQEDQGGRIVILPEDQPERNLVEIVETFDRIDENRLGGRFVLTAHGRSARRLDEQWKLLTLQVSNPSVSGAQALAHFLPKVELGEIIRSSHTGNSDVLSTTGDHHRCELNQFSDCLVGTLAWQHPAVPLDVWQIMNASTFLTFPMPLRFDITCIICRELAERLLDVSAAPELSNDLCDLSTEIYREDGSIRIHRSLVLKAKLPSREQAAQVPETMARVGQAFQVALKFRS